MSNPVKGAQQLARLSHHERSITCEVCGRIAIVHSSQARVCKRRACQRERDRRSRAKKKEAQRPQGSA